MPKITFHPSNQVIDAQKGESILDIALNAGISIQHACGGFCACTTCHCLIEQGTDQLSQMDDDERERLEVLGGRTERSRLACQAKVLGDVTLTVVNSD